MSTELANRTWQPPTATEFEGEHVRLSRLDADRNINDLYDVSHGTPTFEALWTYLWQGPFATKEEMHAWLRSLQGETDPYYYVVQSKEQGRAVGMISILNIVAPMGRAELGGIWYSPLVQKTRVNTETIYLLLRYLFDDLGYRRAEWKCDNNNQESKRAARRLGFSYEGLFRQHMVIKGKNRDTAWFSMLDSEWPTIQRNFQQYLASDNLSLTQLNQSAKSPNE